MKPTEPRRESILDAATRRALLLSAVGLWKDRTDLPDTDEYVREVRKGERLDRFAHAARTSVPIQPRTA
jgi:hypothetical protein